MQVSSSWRTSPPAMITRTLRVPSRLATASDGVTTMRSSRTGRRRAKCSTVVPMPRNIARTPTVSSAARLAMSRFSLAWWSVRALAPTSNVRTRWVVAPPYVRRTKPSRSSRRRSRRIVISETWKSRASVLTSMAWSSATRSNTFKRRSTANTLRNSLLNYSSGLLSKACSDLDRKLSLRVHSLLTPVFDCVQTLPVFGASVKLGAVGPPEDRHGNREQAVRPQQHRAGALCVGCRCDHLQRGHLRAGRLHDRVFDLLRTGRVPRRGRRRGADTRRAHQHSRAHHVRAARSQHAEGRR